MGVGPRLAIEAPQLTPGRRGLLAAAVPVENGDGRWVNGFAFDPETCDEALALPIFCDPGGAEKTAGDNEAIVEYDPWAVLGWDQCTTLQRGRDRVGRARRHLVATEGDQIERELWDGAVARQELLPNAFLASSAATDLGTAGATAALAELEQALGDCLYGRRGMIHATLTTATIWQALGLLRVEPGVPGVLLTALDTIVVAGSGYSGSAPAPGGTGPDNDPVPPSDITAAAFAYATSMVYVRRGDIEVVGGERDQVDRSVNDQTVFVERPVAAYWDGCCHFGIEVDHTSSGVDTTGSVDGGSP